MPLSSIWLLPMQAGGAHLKPEALSLGALCCEPALCSYRAFPVAPGSSISVTRQTQNTRHNSLHSVDKVTPRGPPQSYQDIHNVCLFLTPCSFLDHCPGPCSPGGAFLVPPSPWEFLQEMLFPLNQVTKVPPG